MTEHTRDDLERARAKWWATVSSGDLDGYLSLFAEDAVWVTPELDEIVGRDAIRAWLEPVFAQFDYELTITVADVRVAGDLGIERARFVSRMTPKPVVPQPTPPVVPTAPAAPPAPAAAAPTPLPARDWVPGDEEGEGSAAAPTDAPDGPDTADTADGPDGWGEPTDGEVGEPGGWTADEAVEDAGAGAMPGPGPLDLTGGDGAGAEEVEEAEPVEAPLLPAGPDAGDHEPHEGRYLMYWRWHEGVGWLVHRYADVTGVG